MRNTSLFVPAALLLGLTACFVEKPEDTALAACEPAVEVPYDGVDQDCDGADLTDVDGDGFDGVESDGGTDCDDANAAVNPGATESCTGVDDDCDGLVDDDDDSITGGTQYYADDDSDSYGDRDDHLTRCEQPSGYVEDDTDCDDTDAAVNPGATESCTGVDDDCDGLVDDEDDSITGGTQYYADNDGDSYGDSHNTVARCAQPSGYVEDDTDCNDGSADDHPDADENCDGADNDCDGETDEDHALDTTAWYHDGDGDGYGDADSEAWACDAPKDHVDNAEDCDDADGLLWETCCSLGTDGDLVITASTEMVSGTYSYDTISISSGATLTFTGSQPVIFYASVASIDGTIDISGQDGVDSSSSSAGHGGDAGPGGGGGGGGGDCGNGNGTGGAPNGETPTGSDSDGGDGGAPDASTEAIATGGDWGWGGGGGGGGNSAAGADGEYSDTTKGLGGTSYSDVTLETLFTGGGGGSGGGANGGGGGGGGGAIAVFAYDLTVTGLILADGGDGGLRTSGDCFAGGGGGGGGGMIWLHAEALVLSGDLSAAGGTGGSAGGYYDRYGGDGADGRIRVSGVSVTSSGSEDPAAYTDSAEPDCER